MTKRYLNFAILTLFFATTSPGHGQSTCTFPPDAQSQQDTNKDIMSGSFGLPSLPQEGRNAMAHALNSAESCFDTTRSINNATLA